MAVQLDDRIFIKTVLYETLLKGIKIGMAVFCMDRDLGKTNPSHYQQAENKNCMFDWGHFLSVYPTMAVLWGPFRPCAL